MQRFDHLPVHPVPDSARAGATSALLRIDGLVERPVALSRAEMVGLPRVGLADEFACTEGWTVPDLHWEGVRLSQVLALARPGPEARYVRVGAGEYVVPLALEQAGRALLCDRLDGQPLTLAHGAPWRLLLPGAGCFTSVKWVDRLELCAEPGENSGLRIAQARLARSEADSEDRA